MRQSRITSKPSQPRPTPNAVARGGAPRPTATDVFLAEARGPAPASGLDSRQPAHISDNSGLDVEHGNAVRIHVPAVIPELTAPVGRERHPRSARVPTRYQNSPPPHDPTSNQMTSPQKPPSKRRRTSGTPLSEPAPPENAEASSSRLPTPARVRGRQLKKGTGRGRK